MENKHFYLIGAGGHAKVVISAIRAREWRVLGLFDDDSRKWGSIISGIKVLGSADDALEYAGKGYFVVAIGRNDLRREIVQRLGALEWASVVHPGAYLDPSAVIEKGAVIFAGAVIQPDVRIGAHSIINTAATVDHDATIAPLVHIAPGAHIAGGVEIAEGAFLGIGCAVLPYTSIGAWSIVGAGAVVNRDLPSGVTAMGVPARVVKG